MQGRATPVWLIASSSPCLTKQLHSKRQSHRLLLTHCCLCLQDCHPVRRRPLSEHCRRMGAGPVVRRPHHPQVHVSVFANCGSWLVAASICRDGIAFQAIFSPCPYVWRCPGAGLSPSDLRSGKSVQPGLATIVSGIPSTDDDTILQQPGVHCISCAGRFVLRCSQPGPLYSLTLQVCLQMFAPGAGCELTPCWQTCSEACALHLQLDWIKCPPMPLTS